jgi:hypothetical protein
MKNFNSSKQFFSAILFSLICFGSNAQSLNVSFNLSNYVGYNISCYGDSNGIIEPIITGGHPPYSFIWSTGATTQNISGLVAGDYIFSMYDSTSALAFRDTVTLVQPDSLYVIFQPSTFGAFNVTMHGAEDATIDVQFYGGTPPYWFNWVSSTSWINGMEIMPAEDIGAGTYNLNIGDANECNKLSPTIVLTEPDLLQIVSVSSVATTCHGGNNGKAYVSATGGIPPYTFTWTSNHYISGNTDDTLLNQIAGEYYVEVHSAYGTEVLLDTVIIAEPNAMQVATTPYVYPNNFNVSCYHCYNGSITASVTSNGHPPYNYLWLTGQSTASISTLGKGTYTVSVSDAYGCTGTSSSNLIEAEPEMWKMNGDTLSTNSSKFLGTMNSSDLVIKTDTTERLRIMANGDIKIKQFADTVNRLLTIDAYGKIIPGDVIDGVGGEVYVPCASPAYRISPWVSTRIMGPYGGYDVINCNQRFGFGIGAPLERIHVVGFARFSTASTTNYLNIGYSGNSMINSYGGALLINQDSHQNVKICTTGGIVSIGTVTPITTDSFKLYVRGGIRTEAVKVDVADGVWSDYVFEKNYRLRNIKEISEFINEYKHLPGIPSSQEVEENGVDLLEMQAKLLAKIEELTLYLIKQQNEIDLLKEQIKK